MALLRIAGTRSASRLFDVAFARDGATTFDMNSTILTSRVLCSGLSDHRPGLSLGALLCVLRTLLLLEIAM